MNWSQQQAIYAALKILGSRRDRDLLSRALQTMGAVRMANLTYNWSDELGEIMQTAFSLYAEALTGE